jgi:hypothetical protein
MRRLGPGLACAAALLLAGAAPSAASIERRVAALERTAARLAVHDAALRRWMTCIREVPVTQYGDPDNRAGYIYDGLDGRGPGPMPALDVGSRPGRRPEFRFLAFSSRSRCASAATLPGGTAEAAVAGSPAARLERVGRILRRADASARRFDRWESCLSWIPVTQYGDEAGNFGYRFGPGGAPFRYRPALAIDLSPWDDPDYEFLGFGGGSTRRPRCLGDPGEGVAVTAAAAAAARETVGALEEDAEDIVPAMDEFVTFDQCMFLVGVTRFGTRSGYHFGPHGGGRRSALAYESRPGHLAGFQFLAFPGEEPPQIECNEDASGEGTSE